MKLIPLQPGENPTGQINPHPPGSTKRILWIGLIIALVAGGVLLVLTFVPNAFAGEPTPTSTTTASPTAAASSTTSPAASASPSATGSATLGPTASATMTPTSTRTATPGPTPTAQIFVTTIRVPVQVQVTSIVYVQQTVVSVETHLVQVTSPPIIIVVTATPSGTPKATKTPAPTSMSTPPTTPTPTLSPTPASSPTGTPTEEPTEIPTDIPTELSTETMNEETP